MMRIARDCFVLVILLACKAAGDPVATPPVVKGPPATAMCSPTPAGRAGFLKILFVGNSLTYTNDLPSKVAELARNAGKLMEVEMIAKPNYALEDHWDEGCVQIMIKSGYYDFVVVQQGPSSQSEGARMLLEYGELLSDLCKAHDTKLAFFMVWPAKVNYHTFPGVIANYTNAAYTTGSILCPVGHVWKQKMDTGDFSYYGPDDFHPSVSGTSVAAEIIYKSLFP